MSSKTKIIVLHKKEVIYTVIFAVFSVIILCLMFCMFSSGKKTKKDTASARYNAGVYTSSVQLNGQSVDIQVTVDTDHINAISFKQLDESVAVMYPLMQPALEDLTSQICEKQSLDTISYSTDSQYTSQMLLTAIQEALDKASISD